MRVQSEDRKQRLATALRKNLKRRKAAAQGNQADTRCGERQVNEPASPEHNAERLHKSTY